MRILVTGGSGFVGRHVCDVLLRRGHQVVSSFRSPSARDALPSGVEPVEVAPLGPDTDWRSALRAVDAVVHVAGLAHVTRELAGQEHSRVNAQGTARLAHQAAEAGVRRFVFLSTVKVHAGCAGERAVEATSPYRPDDAYAASKVEAEQALLALEARGALSVSIVRPPLVYGPGVKANFRRMVNMVARGVPLPLGSVRNRRSLVSVWNLADFIAAVLATPEGGGRAWLVSDGEDVSTPELLRRIASAMERPSRVFPFPVPILRALLGAAGMGGELRRLSESFFVDASPGRRDLGWSPPLTMAEGLAATVRVPSGARQDSR